MGFGNASDSTNRTDGVPQGLNPGAPPKQDDGPKRGVLSLATRNVVPSRADGVENSLG
jgi:hypothetical protein